MSSATNRTELLAKALKQCRPDFTLYNARVFARAVIDAPDGVFGAKPLTFLPARQGDVGRVSRDEPPIAGTNLHGPLPAAAGPRVTGEVLVEPIPDSGAEMYRLPAPEVGGAAAPISLSDAVAGDVVVQADGRSGIYLGNGKMVVSDAAGAAEAIVSAKAADKEAPPPQPATGNKPQHAGAGRVASPPPYVVPRPPVPENRTHRHAVKTWDRTDLVLGVTDEGTSISWRPARKQSLAVIGRPGTGKSVVAQSLLDQARAAGWMTLHATTAPRESRDPLQVPGLVASTTSEHGLSGRGLNEFSAVIEIARRIRDHRLGPNVDRASDSGSAVLGRYAPDVPVLVVLDAVDTYLEGFWASAERGAEQSAANVLARLLAQGIDDRVHFVLVSQSRWPQQLPRLWGRDVPAVVLAGTPDGVLAKQLVGVRFSGEPRYKPGRMTWIDRHGAGEKVFVDKPFQGYLGGPQPSVVPGQYPRLALEAGGADLGARTMGFRELGELRDLLLDRAVKCRWEPDPRYSHLDPWAGYR
uniref:FtsK domain-containing protein n=2 Tax=Mycolicibacterium TaxID=1866885 RepID=A0A343VRF6_9MYCO|nr:ATP-binding protein [Mycolicibacterium sp. CBMA 213]AVN58480.1 hypothetical protein B5P44_p00185 [Mycolicibacterium sp. CBMA 213]